MSKRKTKVVTAAPEITASPGQVEQTEPTTETADVTDGEFLNPLMDAVGAPMVMALKPETRYGMVANARFVNVREEASPTADVVRIANEGERFLILYEENGFYKVRFEDESEGFVLMDFVEEMTEGDDPDIWMAKSESILTSVKKLLGIDESCEEFDLDIMLNINAAIFTLRQLGVGPADGFNVTSKNDKYSDFLGEESLEIDAVKLYLYYKTKLAWDSTSLPSSVIAVLEKQIAELEWRLNVQVDPETTFDEG